MSRIHIAAACVGVLFATAASAELRTYDVDFKYQQEVYRALRDILVLDPNTALVPGMTYGRVQLLPTGQILVDTTPATHDEIENLLAEIKARQTEATPRVTLRYWVLLGSSAADAANDAPPILRDALEELERVHGDLKFRVLGTATLMSESGGVGAVRSEPLSATQSVYVQGQTTNARITLEYAETARPPPQAQGAFQTTPPPYRANLTLDVTLERGQFLVLGENTVRTPPLDGTLFYIAHWPASE